MKLTNEKYIRIFDKFRKEFTCIADDKQLKEWGNSNEEIEHIKIREAKKMIRFKEDGIKLKTFIDSIYN